MVDPLPLIFHQKIIIIFLNSTCVLLVYLFVCIFREHRLAVQTFMHNLEINNFLLIFQSFFSNVIKCEKRIIPFYYFWDSFKKYFLQTFRIVLVK
jgi:hypothetical protein